MRAYPTYLLLRGLGSFALACAYTYNLIYQVETVGLTPFQLVAVGTVLEVTCLVAQLPTGVLADRYSRRWSVVAGVLLLGAGAAVEGLVPHVAAVLAGTVVWGVGSTCVDGAEQAWIAGELGEDRAGAAFTRGAQVAQVAAVAGIGAGAVAGSMARALPLLVGAAAWLLLGAVLAVAMPEHHFVPAARTGLRRPRRPRTSRLLLLLLGAVFFLGLGSEGWDRLGPARLLSFPEVGVLTFGLLGVASMLGAAGLTELLRRRLAPDQVGRLLIGLQLARLGAVAVVALGGVLAAAAGWLVAGLLRAAAAPLLDTWLVAATEPGTRATALSAVAQADAAGQILGGPPVGLVGSRVSVPAALLVTGALSVPAVELFRRARVRRHDDLRPGAGGRADRAAGGRGA